MSPSLAVRPYTHSCRYPRHPLCLQQSYIYRTQRPLTVRFCSPAGGHYIGPPTMTSNTLRNIQTDATLTSLPGSPTQMMLTLGWGEEYGHRSDASHSAVTERIIAETGAYYTRELVFSPSISMKSHHECVLYARFYGNFWWWSFLTTAE